MSDLIPADSNKTDEAEKKVVEPIEEDNNSSESNPLEDYRNAIEKPSKLKKVEKEDNQQKKTLTKDNLNNVDPEKSTPETKKPEIDSDVIAEQLKKIGLDNFKDLESVGKSFKELQKKLTEQSNELAKLKKEVDPQKEIAEKEIEKDELELSNLAEEFNNAVFDSNSEKVLSIFKNLVSKITQNNAALKYAQDLMKNDEKLKLNDLRLKIINEAFDEFSETEDFAKKSKKEIYEYINNNPELFTNQFKPESIKDVEAFKAQVLKAMKVATDAAKGNKLKSEAEISKSIKEALDKEYEAKYLEDLKKIKKGELPIVAKSGKNISPKSNEKEALEKYRNGEI